ncbi:hypothetical protein SBV1_70021 [Verrucomicrobia bacterium]|nr:hypothetical protein SBV1_70021 [Verrucomicrobiota bacterium]
MGRRPLCKPGVARRKSRFLHRPAGARPARPALQAPRRNPWPFSRAPRQRLRDVRPRGQSDQRRNAATHQGVASRADGVVPGAGDQGSAALTSNGMVVVWGVENPPPPGLNNVIAPQRPPTWGHSFGLSVRGKKGIGRLHRRERICLRRWFSQRRSPIALSHNERATERYADSEAPHLL